MKILIPILLFGVLLAYLTERTSTGRYVGFRHQTLQSAVFFVLLVIVLSLPVGLRTWYNDTHAYIQGFQNTPALGELFGSGDLHILSNPAFIIYESLLRSVTDNYHIFLMIPAFFVQYSFVSAIRRYSSSFALGIGLYICLGTYVFTFAAMKQTIAMAILMNGIPKLLDRKYRSYYLYVFVAFLFHTYALAFAILPLLAVRPWRARTFVFLFLIFVVMQNFESVIGSFLDYANEQGKSVAEYEVFDNNQINIMRVAVYAVAPLMSLLLSKYLFQGRYDRSYDIMIHMSIISFSFMLLGTINGANMFGRMGNYFEIGMVCSLPWMIRKAFSKASARFVATVAAGCFLFYFVYAYKIALDFDTAYSAISLWEFILSLF